MLNMITLVILIILIMMIFTLLFIRGKYKFTGGKMASHSMIYDGEKYYNVKVKDRDNFCFSLYGGIIDETPKYSFVKFGVGTSVDHEWKLHPKLYKSLRSGARCLTIRIRNNTPKPYHFYNVMSGIEAFVHGLILGFITVTDRVYPVSDKSKENNILNGICQDKKCADMKCKFFHPWRFDTNVEDLGIDNVYSYNTKFKLLFDNEVYLYETNNAPIMYDEIYNLINNNAKNVVDLITQEITEDKIYLPEKNSDTNKDYLNDMFLLGMQCGRNKNIPISTMNDDKSYFVSKHEDVKL